MGKVYQQLCTVSVEPQECKDDTCQGSTSGILINARQNVVLTHASLLYPMEQYLTEKFLSNIKACGKLDNVTFKTKVNVEVTFPNTKVYDSEVSQNTDKIFSTVVSAGSTNDISYLNTYKGKIISVFTVKKLKDILKTLLPNDQWKFEHEMRAASSGNEQNHQPVSHSNEQLYYNLLSCFVLIQLQAPGVRIPSQLTFQAATESMVGNPVEICATPFGSMNPRVFLNSLSHGILSKVAGPSGVLLMTDARCVPGCEGGALFLVKGNKRFPCSHLVQCV